MNSRRWLIVIALLGILHNALRATASILGGPWGFFNYLRPFHARDLSGEVVAQVAGVAAILIFAAALARVLWRKAAPPSTMWSSSLWAAASGAALGLLAAYVSTLADKTYGIALFIAVPFLVGFVAVLVMGVADPVTAYQAFGVSTLAVVVLGLMLIAFAMEGAVCLVMALPVAVPLAICGGMAAYLLQRGPAAHHPATFLLLIGLTPFGATL